MTSDPFAAVAMLGVKVIRCPDLGQDSVWLPDFQLLVVAADLSSGDAEDVACQALGAVVDHLAGGKGGASRVDAYVAATRAEWHRRRRPLPARCDACGTVRTVSASRVRQTGSVDAPILKPYRCETCRHITTHVIDRPV